MIELGGEQMVSQGLLVLRELGNEGRHCQVSLQRQFRADVMLHRLKQQDSEQSCPGDKMGCPFMVCVKRSCTDQ